MVNPFMIDIIYECLINDRDISYIFLNHSKMVGNLRFRNLAIFILKAKQKRLYSAVSQHSSSQRA